MKINFPILSLALMLAAANASAADSAAAPKEKVFEAKPLGIQLSIKMVRALPWRRLSSRSFASSSRKIRGHYQGAAKDTGRASRRPSFRVEEANDLELSRLHVGPDHLDGQLDASGLASKTFSFGAAANPLRSHWRAPASSKPDLIWGS